MKNMLRLSVWVVVLAGLVERECSAAITWNITYADTGSGFGFDDPTQGATRRNTITAVTSYINSVIVADGTVDLLFGISDNDPNSGALAGARPYYSNSPNGFENGLPFDHATTGMDPFPFDPDGDAVFNFGSNFNSGLAAPTAGQYDLFSVALHEVTHALGFLSLVTPPGVSGLTGIDPGIYSVFDSFLIRGSTGMALFAAGGDFIGTAADLVSDDIFYDSESVRAANGGNPIKVYAPSTFRPGSSLSHLVLTDAVMQFSIPDGVARRQYSVQELAILQDLGYSVITPASVPEPSSYVLLTLVGLAYGLKRRRRVPAERDLAV